jgi:hypothetical protein
MFELGDFEMLAGNLASIGVGAIIATVSSLIVSFTLLLLLWLTQQSTVA